MKRKNKCKRDMKGRGRFGVAMTLNRKRGLLDHTFNTRKRAKRFVYLLQDEKRKKAKLKKYKNPRVIDLAPKNRVQYL